MQKNKTIFSSQIIALLCVTLPFFVFSSESPKKEYFMEAKGKGLTFRLSVNGFLISEENRGCANISYYLRAGTNEITVDNLRYDNGTMPTISITVDNKMIHRKSDIGVVAWEITVSPAETNYRKQFVLKEIQVMPWETAEQVRELSESDRERVKKLAMDYVELLVVGKNEPLRNFYSSKLKWHALVESNLKGIAQDALIAQALYINDKMWGPTARKSVARATEAELTVFKSSQNDRIIMVTTTNGSPILKIESGMMTDEEKMGLGSKIDFVMNKLVFIKVEGDWYIYE